MANTAEKTFRNQLNEELPTLISDKLYRLARSWVGAEVAAANERCAKLAEVDRVVMPLADEPIEETTAFVQRCIAAAIRQAPEPSK